jgi:hypothetical protein
LHFAFNELYCWYYEKLNSYNFNDFKLALAVLTAGTQSFVVPVAVCRKYASRFFCETRAFRKNSGGLF